jgi:hypothetical protein
MSEAWFFDTALPLAVFLGIFGIPLFIFGRQTWRRVRPQKERQHG